MRILTRDCHKYGVKGLRFWARVEPNCDGGTRRGSVLAFSLTPEQPQRDARRAVCGGGAQLMGGAVAKVVRQREGDGRDRKATR